MWWNLFSWSGSCTESQLHDCSSLWLSHIHGVVLSHIHLLPPRTKFPFLPTHQSHLLCHNILNSDIVPSPQISHCQWMMHDIKYMLIPQFQSFILGDVSWLFSAQHWDAECVQPWWNFFGNATVHGALLAISHLFWSHPSCAWLRAEHQGSGNTYCGKGWQQSREVWCRR